MNNRPKTIFIDIDGTLLWHYGTQSDQITNEPKLLSGVHRRFHEWEKNGYYIVLTTARKKGLKKITKEQLKNLGIIYDDLIMGITGGQRVLINDLKSDSEDPTAIAICVKKNCGISDIEL